MAEERLQWLVPDWDVPRNVKCLVTTRYGGVSADNYSGWNLAAHVGDDVVAVRRNRLLLKEQCALPAEPVWLEQVHSNEVVDLNGAGLQVPPVADGAYTASSNAVCAVLTADCLPLLLCSTAGDFVAAVHCGWRGVAAGIVEQAVARYSGGAQSLQAWLGPAIGPKQFQVGQVVVHTFVSAQANAASCFVSQGDDRFLADLPELVALRLRTLGVGHITFSEQCTVSQKQWYSHRRDGSGAKGHTGRFASLIWLES